MNGAGQPAERRSYLEEPDGAEAAAVIADLARKVGPVPNFFRVQANRPGLIDGQLGLVFSILGGGSLTRQQKEYVFLVCAAANLSTYCVTSHCEIIRMLGIEGPEPEQVALDYTATSLPMEFKALLAFAAKLNRSPHRIAERDIMTLRTFGYSDDQILEAVLTVALARFSNTVSLGLGLVPDIDNPAIQQAIAARASA